MRENKKSKEMEGGALHVEVQSLKVKNSVKQLKSQPSMSQLMGSANVSHLMNEQLMDLELAPGAQLKVDATGLFKKGERLQSLQGHSSIKEYQESRDQYLSNLHLGGVLLTAPPGRS